MIPLRDRNPAKHFPIITVMLIIVNILLFFYQLSLGLRLEEFLYNFSVIPNEIQKAIHFDIFRPLIFVTFVTSLFLHGGWLHLIGNMLYLWIFGDNIEDKLGHMRFLLFYLLCGIAASVVHIYIEPTSTLPTIGASGAISGVLGGYVIMFPRARVLTLVPIFLFIRIVELPAYLILGLWFVIQFFNGMLALGHTATGMGGVAWWAHIGGFIAGIIFVIPFRKYR